MLKMPTKFLRTQPCRLARRAGRDSLSIAKSVLESPKYLENTGKKYDLRANGHER